MSALLDHLVIVPVVLPLATGALLLLLEERRYALKGALSLVSLLALIAAAVELLRRADLPAIQVYRVGEWAAPFGIVLVADRLSALMVALASVLGIVALLYSLARWHRAAPRFHALLQFLLMGVNGAFLTGDLFNLFVFFEVLLAASFGLALHGSGIERVRANLHYVAVNLAASLLFLIGASLLYGVAGTLTMADLALQAQHLPAQSRGLFDTGVAVLGIAFLVKAGIWPLGFWLPATYAAAAAPAAALFALLTKVGIYAVMRVWLLIFGQGESAGFGADLLFLAGAMTLVFGSIGVLAARDLGRLAGFSLFVSSGTLLAVTAVARADATAGALYYLVVSTLGVAAFFLLIEIIERRRHPVADLLAVTAEAFGIEERDEREEEVGIAIPSTMVLIGLAFLGCALLLASLPPLPGFLAKFALFAALVQPVPVPASAWVLIVLLTLSGVASLIALSRFGIRVFWGAEEAALARVRVVEFAPIVLVLLLCGALTVAAEPVMQYMQATAQALHAPGGYLRAVLAPP